MPLTSKLSGYRKDNGKGLFIRRYWAPGKPHCNGMPTWVSAEAHDVLDGPWREEPVCAIMEWRGACMGPGAALYAVHASACMGPEAGLCFICGRL
jgi:hypothetical protein